jgi:signal transduction histidine kinase
VNADAPVSVRPESPLQDAHARFGRRVMLIYLGTAALSTLLLLATLITDLQHQKQASRETLSLETQVRAHYLSRHLQLLADELTRLGLRSEVNLLDENMEPEMSLLRLSHEKSAFFNVGVAILGADGAVLWSEPRRFLSAGELPGSSQMFQALKDTHAIQVVPDPGGHQHPTILYVASPILRGGAFAGALLGAIDLVSGRTLEARPDRDAQVAMALVAPHGVVIAPPGGPPTPEAFLDGRLAGEPFVGQLDRDGQTVVAAGSPVQGTPFVLLSQADAHRLFGPAYRRFATRLLVGLTVAAVPLVMLTLLLRNSLRTFRESEEHAVHDDRLKSLGEAADAIAHEVKNSLNGLRLALDMILSDEGMALEARHRRAVAGLRAEIEHLSDFTTELLSFSKGVVPRPVSLDLGEFARKVVDLTRDTADTRGISLDVPPPDHAVRVHADPTLIHVVISNLVRNALDFAGSRGITMPGVVVISVERSGTQARVRVADNGPGVSHAVRPRLFEPFVTGKPSGVGLGLALSRTIARAHGGDLVLVDSPRGAAFALTLPLEQP